MKEEFYTRGRWLNWTNMIKESDFRLPDSEEGDDTKEGDVSIFVNIMDDIVLACLKIIARFERNYISKEDALSEIGHIREIISERNEPLGEDADIMLDSLKTSLSAVFMSCERYIEGDYDRQTNISSFVERAAMAEKNGEIDQVMSLLSEIGARVISGEPLPDESMDNLPYCIVAELLDGIDAISAAMVGDDSYKEDDGTHAEDF
jgi:hypothetical protein